MSKTCLHPIITDGCKSCSRLQSQWYGKLKDFDDIESTKYSDRPLKTWHNTAFRKVQPFEIEGIVNYYQKASRFLNLHAFQNETIKRIWELHCEGLSRHEIEQHIHGFDITYKQSTIRHIIQDLNREMEDASYTDDGIDDMIITIRDFDPDIDTGLILESMGKSLYYDSHPRKGRPSHKWFANFNEYFKDTIPYAEVLIAVAQNDPNLILGYTILVRREQGIRIEYIYVKDAYRKQGIASLMIRGLDIESVNQNNLTKLGKKIMAQKAEAQPPIEDAHIGQTPMTQIDALKLSGFKVKKATFQSAILSGFNAAESQLSMDSSNKLRVPEEMYYTQGGLIVVQNKQTFIISLANIIQVCI